MAGSQPVGRAPDQGVLTLGLVAERPELLARRVRLPSGGEYHLRPLVESDEARLRAFYEGLSERTRRFYSITFPAATMAAELCGAIGRYDKLRLVVTDGPRIVGLVELSFDIPEGDHERYASYGHPLDQETDCRFAVCLADEVHGQGLGSVVFPCVREIARRFGRSRIILWGGVRTDNEGALAYYRKCGFQVVGEFVNRTGAPSLDMMREVS